MLKIDINADLGESYGPFTVGDDKRLMPVISSANVACGFHAGDYNVICETLDVAKQFNVAVGAHPGFQDLFGFGRREMLVSKEEVYRIVLYQLGAMNGFCQVKGIKLQHVKPHGALYNLAARNRDIAEGITAAVKDFDSSLILFGLCNSELIKAGEEMGLKVAREAFADRSYTKDGLLTPRNEKNAVLTNENEMINQVVRIITENAVVATDGSIVPLHADTICFHGDGAETVKKLKKVHAKFNDIGVVVEKVGD